MSLPSRLPPPQPAGPPGAGGRRLRLRPLAAALLVTVLAAGAAMAYPKPARVPYRWELQFKPGDLRLYVDSADGQAFWYFTYTVINRTGAERIWVPSFVLFTDEGEILRSGAGVPSRIEQRIRDLLGNPLLETQNEVIGDLFQGPEHALEGLVVWPAAKVTVNELSLFIGGLSGETAPMKHPVTGESIILRKTLQRDYLIPGDALARGSKPVDLVGQSWVMR